MPLTVLPLEIRPNQSLSNALDCRAGKIMRIGMPDDWTAAPLTFQVSPDGVNYLDLYHAQVTTGAFVPYEAIVLTVVPNSILSLPPTLVLALDGSRFVPAPGRRLSIKLRPASSCSCSNLISR